MKSAVTRNKITFKTRDSTRRKIASPLPKIVRPTMRVHESLQPNAAK